MTLIFYFDTTLTEHRALNVAVTKNLGIHFNPGE